MGRNSVTRRQFIHFGAGAVAAGAAAKVTLLNPTHLSAFAGPVPPSDQVRFASQPRCLCGCPIHERSSFVGPYTNLKERLLAGLNSRDVGCETAY